MNKRYFFLLVVFLIGCQQAVPLDGSLEATSRITYFVSPSGLDTNPGTRALPFRTVQKCATVALPGTVCHLRAGVYRETVTPANSGTASAPIWFVASNNEEVTISGADSVTTWQPYQGDIYQADVTLPVANYADTGFLANQVFVSGTMTNEARWPNGTTDLLRPALSNGGLDLNGRTVTITNPNLPNVGLEGAVVWMNEWFVSRTAVVQSSSSGTLTATVNDNSNWNRAAFWYSLSGALGLLDEAGEWFYDAANNKLYLWQPGGGVPNNVEVKQRNFAFDLTDRSYIRLKNINLFASTLTTSDSSTNIVLDGLDAKYLSHHVTLPDLPASEVAPGTDGFGLIASHTHDTGLQLRGTRHTLRNSRIAYSSGNGVLLEGTGHVLTNNVIHDANYLSSYAAPVKINGNSHKITYNTLYRSGRSAIEVQWQTNGFEFKDSEIAYNDIYAWGALSADLGGLYVCCYTDMSGTRIHRNHFHDPYVFSPFWDVAGIYFDINAYGATVNRNVVWNIAAPEGRGVSLKAGSDRGTTRVFNNTFLEAFEGNDSLLIYNNILRATTTLSGQTASNNLLADVDPLFVDPASNFRLQSTSPAIDAGRILSGVSRGFVGSAPDIGAYEFGGADWRVGATLPSP